MTVAEEVEDLAHRVKTLRQLAMDTEHFAVEFLDCLRACMFYDAAIIAHCERLIELEPLNDRWRISLKYAEKMALQTEAAMVKEMAEMREDG